MAAKIDIFISYVREERHLAELYASALIGAGYTVVTDLEIEKGADFGEVIDGMIRAARLVVVLWTHKSAQSRWVNEEILAFKRLGKSHRIFCLIVEGEPLVMM